MAEGEKFYEKELAKAKLGWVNIEKNSPLVITVAEHITKPGDRLTDRIVKRINIELYGKPAPMNEKEILRKREKEYRKGKYNKIKDRIIEQIIYEETADMIERKKEEFPSLNNDPRVGLSFMRNGVRTSFEYSELTYFPPGEEISIKLDKNQRRVLKNILKDIKSFNKKYSLNLAFIMYTEAKKEKNIRELTDFFLEHLRGIADIKRCWIMPHKFNSTLRYEHVYHLQELKNVDEIIRELAYDTCFSLEDEQEIKESEESLKEEWGKLNKKVVDEIRIRAAEKIHDTLNELILKKAKISKIRGCPSFPLIFEQGGCKTIILLRPFYSKIAGPDVYPPWKGKEEVFDMLRYQDFRDERDMILEKILQDEWLKSLERRNYVNLTRVIASEGDDENLIKRIINEYSLTNPF